MDENFPFVLRPSLSIESVIHHNHSTRSRVVIIRSPLNDEKRNRIASQCRIVGLSIHVIFYKVFFLINLTSGSFVPLFSSVSIRIIVWQQVIVMFDAYLFHMNIQNQISPLASICCVDKLSFSTGFFPISSPPCSTCVPINLQTSDTRHS